MAELACPQPGARSPAWLRGTEPPAGRASAIHIVSCGRVGYLRLAGPLDEGATLPFRGQAQHLLRTGCRTLILDLSGAAFADSHGLRALLRLREETEERGASLRVVVSQGSPVERTLRLLRFDALFAIFASAAAAWRRRPPEAREETESALGRSPGAKEPQ